MNLISREPIGDIHMGAQARIRSGKKSYQRVDVLILPIDAPAGRNLKRNPTGADAVSESIFGRAPDIINLP